MLPAGKAHLPRLGELAAGHCQEFKYVHTYNTCLYASSGDFYNHLKWNVDVFIHVCMLFQKHVHIYTQMYIHTYTWQSNSNLDGFVRLPSSSKQIHPQIRSLPELGSCLRFAEVALGQARLELDLLTPNRGALACGLESAQVIMMIVTIVLIIMLARIVMRVTMLVMTRIMMIMLIEMIIDSKPELKALVGMFPAVSRNEG